MEGIIKEMKRIEKETEVLFLQAFYLLIAGVVKEFDFTIPKEFARIYLDGVGYSESDPTEFTYNGMDFTVEYTGDGMPTIWGSGCGEIGSIRFSLADDE